MARRGIPEDLSGVVGNTTAPAGDEASDLQGSVLTAKEVAMWKLCLLLALAMMWVSLAGCSSSGVKHWTKACEHQLKIKTSTSENNVRLTPEQMTRFTETCVASFKKMTPDAADKAATCILNASDAAKITECGAPLK